MTDIHRIDDDGLTLPDIDTCHILAQFLTVYQTNSIVVEGRQGDMQLFRPDMVHFQAIAELFEKTHNHGAKCTLEILVHEALEGFTSIKQLVGALVFALDEYFRREIDGNIFLEDIKYPLNILIGNIHVQILLAFLVSQIFLITHQEAY